MPEVYESTHKDEQFTRYKDVCVSVCVRAD